MNVLMPNREISLHPVAGVLEESDLFEVVKLEHYYQLNPINQHDMPSYWISIAHFESIVSEGLAQYGTIKWTGLPPKAAEE